MSRPMSISKPCTSCGGIIGVDHPQGGSREVYCMSTTRQVCKICFMHLATDEIENGECDRCSDEGDMMRLGNG